jgi:hypothetical protein
MGEDDLNLEREARAAEPKLSSFNQASVPKTQDGKIADGPDQFEEAGDHNAPAISRPPLQSYEPSASSHSSSRPSGNEGAAIELALRRVDGIGVGDQTKDVLFRMDQFSQTAPDATDLIEDDWSDMETSPTVLKSVDLQGNVVSDMEVSQTAPCAPSHDRVLEGMDTGQAGGVVGGTEVSPGASSVDVVSHASADGMDAVQEGEFLSNTSVKEATVYIVDVGRSMGETDSGRNESDLEWSMGYVWDKITATVGSLQWNVVDLRLPRL